MQKKRMNRKGQLTLFFLIGILLIAAFAFVWYLNTRVAEEQLQAPTEKLITDLLKTGAIPYYVGVCLENASKEGIVLAGKQAGDIFIDQGGSAPSPVRYVGDRVPYGISAPFLVNGTVYPYPPGYPGGEGRLQQVPELNFRTEGRFGEVTLRGLCDSYGANSPYARYVFGTGADAITHIFCQAPYIYEDTLSTQWQLERFVEKTIVNCTDWEAIQDETGYNITPTGDPNVTVRLGLNDVYVDAYIPIVVRVGGREPVYTVGDFHTRLPVRLKTLVEYAMYLATYDAYRLNFNLTEHYQYPSIWDSNIDIRVTTPLKALGVWEEIITIEDAASVVDGENYIYQFARQNRYPALDYIGQELTNWTQFDIVLMENDTISIAPNPPNKTMPDGSLREYIYDPDEDNLTYYYTGWKSTCDEQFNFELGIPNIECSRKEPTHPRNFFRFPNKGVRLLSTLPGYPLALAWKLMDLWNDRSSLLSDNEEYPPDAPLNWTGSEAYKETRRNATYTPHHDDIGPHNLTVWACDEAGKCDYQIVRLMVFDYPDLHINGTNPYEDIPHDKASVEDFYRLSSEGSRAYFSPLAGYVFSDAEEPFEYRIDHPLQIIDLPRSRYGWERDIRYIWNFTFNRTSHCLNGGCAEDNNKVEHQINLSLTVLDVPPRYMNVTVYQCLPHRNQLNPEWAMWPYNTSGYDPYEASHMCCSIGGEYNFSFEVPTDLNEEGTIEIRNQYGVELGSVTLHDEEDETIDCPEITDGEPIPRCVKTITDETIELTFTNPELYANPLNYTLKQTAADTAFYTEYPWGSWLPETEQCYGGNPKVGVLEFFEETDIPYSPPVVGETQTDYAGVTFAPGEERVAPDAWRNDVMLMKFARYCSGDRGNICNGRAERYFEPLDECPNMQNSELGANDYGEIESCMGPPRTLTSRELVPTGRSCEADIDCGDGNFCLKDECFERPTDSCGHYRQGETFESVFNLNRTFAPDQEADGTCNPNPTCAEDENTYDVETDEGRYLIESATCNLGECNWPKETKDCWDYNGYTDTRMIQNYCELSSDKTHFFTSIFKCQADEMPVPARGAECTRDLEAEGDPDANRNACEACTEPTNAAESMNGAWTGSTCCGDDIGEGGFAYGLYGTPEVTSTSGNGLNGEYQPVETVCDDYYGGDSTLIENWIDNDCENGANCEDWHCYSPPSGADPKRGPSGGYCCHAPSDCREVLSEPNDEYIGCGTEDAPLECDCLNTKDTTNPTSFSEPYATYTLGSEPLTLPETCISSFAYDKHIQVNYELDFSAEVESSIDIVDDGVDHCLGLVNAQVVENPHGTFVVFDSVSTVDCLITVTLEPS